MPEQGGMLDILPKRYFINDTLRIRENPRFPMVAPGSRYTINGSSKKMVLLCPYVSTC